MKQLKKTIWLLLLLEIFIIFIMLVLMISICGARIEYFLNILSLLFILLPTVPILLLSGLGKDFIMAFKVGQKDCSLLQMKKSLEAISMVQKLILCGIGLGITVETISFLHKMTGLTSLGPALSIIILSLFYGILFECMLIPLATFVQYHIINAMNIEDEEP